jgi:hypothetical protein
MIRISSQAVAPLIPLWCDERKKEMESEHD